MNLKYIFELLEFLPRGLFEFRLNVEVHEHIEDSFYLFYHCGAQKIVLKSV